MCSSQILITLSLFSNIKVFIPYLIHLLPSISRASTFALCLSPASSLLNFTMHSFDFSKYSLYRLPFPEHPHSLCLSPAHCQSHHDLPLFDPSKYSLYRPSNQILYSFFFSICFDMLFLELRVYKVCIYCILPRSHLWDYTRCIVVGFKSDCQILFHQAVLEWLKLGSAFHQDLG